MYSIFVPSIETGGDFMSNHSGSRMLNDIIQLLNDEEVLNTIGLQKSQQVITQIVDIASRIYDCNSGEILDGHTDYLNICLSSKLYIIQRLFNFTQWVSSIHVPSKLYFFSVEKLIFRISDAC